MRSLKELLRSKIKRLSLIHLSYILLSLLTIVLLFSIVKLMMELTV